MRTLLSAGITLRFIVPPVHIWVGASEYSLNSYNRVGNSNTLHVQRFQRHTRGGGGEGGSDIIGQCGAGISSYSGSNNYDSNV